MPMYRAYDDEGRCFLIDEAGLEASGPDILKPPHLVKLPPEPQPEPLTEDDLAAILHRWESRYLLKTDDLRRLVAEVRHLRAELAASEDRASMLHYEVMDANERY